MFVQQRGDADMLVWYLFNESQYLQIADPADEYDPGAQGRQSSEPAGEYMPAAHCLHCDDAPRENVPASHREQVVDPRPENDPAGHSWHTVKVAFTSTNGEKKPDGQSTL